MLVLSRKVGERIHVGNDIVLEIRRIAGNRVTLALDAPRNVRILRGELERAAREFQAVSATPATEKVNGDGFASPGAVSIFHGVTSEPAGHDCTSESRF